MICGCLKRPFYGVSLGGGVTNLPLPTYIYCIPNYGILLLWVLFYILLVMGSSTYMLHLFVYLIVRNICISCCGQTIPLYFQRLALCYFYLLQCEGGMIQLIK